MTLCRSESRASAERQHHSSATVGKRVRAERRHLFVAAAFRLAGRACSGEYDSPTAGARGDRRVRLVDHGGA